MHLLDNVEVSIEDIKRLQTIEKESAFRTSQRRPAEFTPPNQSSFILRTTLIKLGNSIRTSMSVRDVKSVAESSRESREDDSTYVEPKSVDRSMVKSTKKFKKRIQRNKGESYPVSIVDDEPYNIAAEETISVAAGIKARDEDDAIGVLTDAKKIVYSYLSEKATAKLDFSFLEQMLSDSSLKESTAKLVKQKLPEFKDRMKLAATVATEKIRVKDIRALRKTVFQDLQVLCIETMVLMKAHLEFKHHNEYRRYLKKYARVYNFICHKDFDFMQTLGKGSFGRVIRVRKRTTKEQYALKIMSKKKILSGAENREQTTIEKQVLVLCFASKFIVGLHFAFQTTRALFIALDLLEGGTLVEAMMRSEPHRLSVNQLRVISAHVILALNHMHLHGILYRDLKPVNIMLNTKGAAVLTDLGLCGKYQISMFEEDTHTKKEDPRVDLSLVCPYNDHLLEKEKISSRYKDNTVKKMPLLTKQELKCVGTPGYRAPELLAISSSTEIKRRQGKKGYVPNRNGYGHEVDYWALGVTLYYLNTALYPYRNRSKFNNLFGPSHDMKINEINQQKQTIDFRKEFEDEHFGDLIAGLLEKKPEHRLGHSIRDLQRHPFFTKFDYVNNTYLDSLPKEKTAHVEAVWQRFVNSDIKPVYKPSARSRPKNEKPRFKGLSDAMRQFAQENVLELFGGGENDIVEDFRHIRSKYQKFFDEWDYIPDELLERDWKILEQYFGE